MSAGVDPGVQSSPVFIYAPLSSCIPWCLPFSTANPPQLCHTIELCGLPVLYRVMTRPHTGCSLSKHTHTQGRTHTLLSLFGVVEKPSIYFKLSVSVPFCSLIKSSLQFCISCRIHLCCAIIHCHAGSPGACRSDRYLNKKRKRIIR